MDRMDYWSRKTNPQTGEKFETWLAALRRSHNGECDIDALIATEYGEEMAKLSELRYTFEEDTMGEACLDFYRQIGVKKEQFEAEDFYTRWFLFTPLGTEAGKKYPLLFWHHGGGNQLETDEFSNHLTQMVGREKFMVCMLQNTRWDNVDRVLDILLEKYPVDPERVYVVGYSQGGQAAHSAGMRIPRRLAGVVPCGAEIFQYWDHNDVRYTLSEVEEVTAAFLPVMEIVGQYEFLNFLPMNRWCPIKLWEGGGPVNLWQHPGNDPRRDPTNPVGKRADKPFPPQGVEPDAFKLNRLNTRLDTLGCERVDVEKCLAYRDTPEDELHHALGFYGDREQIRTFYGIRHYQIDFYNRDGFNALRYIGVENNPHWPLLMMGELAWEFLRQYRRDSATGKIVFDEYKA